MFNQPDTKDEARSLPSADHASADQKEPNRRKRRPLRIVLITLGSLFTLVIVAVVNGIGTILSGTFSTVQTALK